MAKPTQLVQVLKWESSAGGGDPADDVPFPDEIQPGEDVLSAAGVAFQPSGVQNLQTMIWLDPDTDDMMFEDPIVGSGVSLQQLLEGSGITSSDEQVKVSIDDTTAGFLEDKLVAGSGIDVTVLNDGGNEQIEVSASGLPEPTCCGQQLVAIDGEFVPSLPLTSTGPDHGGWLMNNNGTLLVVG